jgi:hypothetical protein
MQSADSLWPTLPVVLCVDSDPAMGVKLQPQVQMLGHANDRRQVFSRKLLLGK